MGRELMSQLRKESSNGALPCITINRSRQTLNLYGKHRLFGIGPDVTMAVFQKGGTLGLVNARYLRESAGHSTFQGSTFVVGFTIARPKP